MQHAWKHVERPGGSHTALDGKKIEKVQQHLDINRQRGQDLTQLAQEVHCDKDSRSWIPTWISTCTSCCTTICCTTSSNAGGTICDSDVWNARICLELCGCTAQYSSDTSSGTQGTSGTVDFYATCSNWGRNGIESATTTAFVLMVADESGQPRRAAVSPTRHLPGSKLSGNYLNEFGLGCIHHAGGFHRRLPDGFLPK